MDLRGKVAIVTGAGRGIGKAIAIGLALQGAHVCAAARTRGQIDAVVSDIERLGSGKAIAVETDVSREEDVKAMVAETVSKFGTVDLLINNAGIGSFAKVAEMTTQAFDAMWSVNMRGVFLCSREVLPFMIGQKSGDILNIASLAGRNAIVGGAGYCATKWGLIGFARSLMLEVREYDIRVITLCPGSVDTSFGGRSAAGRTPSTGSSGAIPTAEDIARVAVDTLRMPRSVMVSEVDIRPTNPQR